MRWKSRRVLVTGATGMVGSALTRRLLGEGANVVTLIRDMDPMSELLRSGMVRRVAVVNGDLADRRTVRRAVIDHEIDVIFHLGAQTIVGAAARDPVATFESNVAGTWNILEAVRTAGESIRAVVVASSDKAYGAQPDLPYREHHPLQGRAPYEVSKSCADLITSSYHETYELPVVTARCGNIYGPGDVNWSRIVPGTVRALLLGEQPVLRSDGTFLRDYIYVEDVVSAYLILAESILDPRVVGEAFNFSDGSPLAVNDIYRSICNVVEGSFVEPLVLNDAKGEIHDQYLSPQKAHDVLGWEPSWSLTAGLTDTIAWYRGLLDVEPLRETS